MAAECHFNLHLNGWTNDPELNHCEGVNLARQALRVASDDPGVLSGAAHALAYFGEDIDAAIELADCALALNPSFARGWAARVECRLAAILAADVAGYSRLIEADEEGTLGRLKTLRAEVIDPKIADHKGRIVKTTGDGLLVEFAASSTPSDAPPKCRQH